MNDSRSFTLALFNDDVDELDRLLAKGLDPNQTSETGDTPFIAAARLAKSDTFLMKLFEGGGDLESRHEANGQTALLIVSQSGIAKRVKLLLKLGADPNVTDDFGQTPLFVALVLDHKRFVPVVRALLAAGADPNHAGARNPLSAAAESAHPDCLKALLAAGAKVNAVWESGTALIRAILEGRHEIVRLLMEAGADPHLSVPVECDDPKIAGRNAFEIAELLGNADALALLRQGGD